ncbi:single-stranded DNA-binding protein [Paenibacillus sp. EKM212P]|jgi:single-strand DNA-binding protein|uniref:single-stranded DNA-binding protein n=1 Tax=Paenibacillus sp. EKM212P TaxID=1683680 RepID=UPI0013EAD444|nr:single-stranded DNA-binding protein [Paenibacillus sp. EKM212P]KAF6578327.1 single-stranded DNA-binding protein [Paenibacillus sp. EKM212P]
MLNLSVLIGRLTRDPELKYTPSGIANTTFTLAVDNPFSKDKEADFIPIVVWRQQAEACANYLRKGRLCAIEGRIATRNYEKDGRKVYVTEIIANNVRFLERPENGGQQLERQDPDYSRGVSDDDLPF